MLHQNRPLFAAILLAGSCTFIAAAATLFALAQAPPPPAVAPTLPLEDIYTLVARTFTAEEALSTPDPVSAAPTLPIEAIYTLVAQTFTAEEALSATVALAAHTDVPPPTPIQTATPTAAPSTTPTAWPTATPTVTLPPQVDCVPTGTLRQVARVLSVTDGDTIRVGLDGQSVPVRYIGIDTPEVGQLFAGEATAHNRSLVQGQTVTLVRDVSETDQYGRLVRYVLVGSVFVNDRMVRDGYAYASTYPPDVACRTTFALAQGEAESEGRGLWAATQAPVCDDSYPDFCIKPPPPDLDCVDVGRTNFTVLPPDPHRFDRDGDGVGCEESAAPPPEPTVPPSGNCDPSYPTVCIPPPPPDLDCPQIPYQNFTVVGSDPHGFDRDNDGIGCET